MTGNPDVDCIVRFENDQTRLLKEWGWRFYVIDMRIWRQPVNGYIATSRYAAHGEILSDQVWHGTTAEGDTVEQATLNFVRRIAHLTEQGGVWAKIGVRP